MEQAHLKQLHAFIDVCKSNPAILYTPQLAFFKEYLESLGAKIPPPPQRQDSGDADSNLDQDEPSSPPKKEASPEPEEMAEESPESDLDIDMTGVIEGDSILDQEMGNADAEPTDEDIEASDEKRSEAMSAASEGNWDEAVNLYTEAIKRNPLSAVLYAKRAQCYLKQQKPNAAIKDCDRAIAVNPDSAQGYKWRGRAHMLLGHWEQADYDLANCTKIDCGDEDALAWLKEVLPKAKKVQEHNRKYAMKREEKERQERIARIKKAREEAEKQRKESAEREKRRGPGGMPGGFPGGMPGGMPFGFPGAGGAGMGNLGAIFNDPEIMTAFSDPEVQKAFQDVAQNPANMYKYENNPKVKRVLDKLAQQFGDSSMDTDPPTGASGSGAGPFGGPGSFGGASGMPDQPDID